MLLNIADQTAFPSNSTREQAQPPSASPMPAMCPSSICAAGLCAIEPWAMYGIYMGSSLC